MADNTLINQASVAGGDIIATLDQGGIKHEKVILEHLIAGVPVMTDADNPLPVTDANVAKEFGVRTYEAGTLSGAGLISAVGRCVGIRVFASGVDGEFNINGGDTIIIRNGSGFDDNPKGCISNPIVNWVSGVIDVVIQVVN